MDGVSQEEKRRVILLGSDDAENRILVPMGDRDEEYVQALYHSIRECSTQRFQLIVMPIKNWNKELSPWEAPAVFGKEDFGSGAEITLQYIQKELLTPERKGNVYLAGYSLGGLFSLWAATQIGAFSGVAAVSPSVWFPGWVDYAQKNESRSRKVYLSLGDKEPKTRNPVMSTVGHCIEAQYAILKNQGIVCTLEWNPGNHFQDSAERMAKGISWLLNN